MSKSQKNSKEMQHICPISVARPGETPIFRHIRSKDKIPPYNAYDPDCKILRESFEKSFLSHNKKNYIYTRSKVDDKFHPITYEQGLEHIKNIGSGIINLGFAPERQEYKNFKVSPFGIISYNRAEWLLLDLASIFYKLTIAPFYVNMTKIEVAFELTNITTLFASKEPLFELLSFKKKLGNLKNIVCFDQLTEQEIKQIKDANYNYYPYSDILEAGKKNQIDYHTIKIDPDDIYTFIFTSGTTGAPKISMFNNRAIMACLSTQILDEQKIVVENDVELSIAPLTHAAERYLCYLLEVKGCEIYMFCQDMNKLMQDFKESQPTVVAMASRFFNRIYEKIQAKIETFNPIKKFLVKQAFRQKIENLEKYGYTAHALWDRLVFNKMRKELLGEKIRFLLTGASPITKTVYQGIKIIYGNATFAQSYGSTEGGCVEFITHPDEQNVYEYVGSTQLLSEFKVIDVPEYNAISNGLDENGKPVCRGELAVRGEQIFSGYYKNEEETQKIFTDDGFLLMGDLVELKPNGLVKILERKKNIFKTLQSGGIFISPEYLENIYTQAPMVSEIYFYGDTKRYYSVAIVSPKKDEIIKFAQQQQVQGSYEELCKNPIIHNYVMGGLNEIAKKYGLYEWEVPKKIHLEFKTFSELKLLTISMKIQRIQARHYFMPIIEKLYEN